MLFLCGDGIDALHKAIGILHNLLLSVGDMDRQITSHAVDV